jgi:hypothetical protein
MGCRWKIPTQARIHTLSHWGGMVERRAEKHAPKFISLQEKGDCKEGSPRYVELILWGFQRSL